MIKKLLEFLKGKNITFKYGTIHCSGKLLDFNVDEGWVHVGKTYGYTPLEDRTVRNEFDETSDLTFNLMFVHYFSLSTWQDITCNYCERTNSYDVNELELTCNNCMTELVFPKSSV